MLPAFQLKLWSASETGDVAEVERCLKLGADVATKNRLGWNALHRGCMSGSIECVQLMLPNERCACEALLAKGDDAGNTPLHIAAGCGHAQMVSLLLRSGAAVDAAKSEAEGGACEGDTPMHTACKALAIADTDELRERLMGAILQLLHHGGLLEAQNKRGRMAASFLTQPIMLQLLSRIQSLPREEEKASATD